MSHQESVNNSRTIFPAYYLGNVPLFYPVSKMSNEERSELLFEACFITCQSARLNVNEPQNRNRTVDMRRYLCDTVSQSSECFHDIIRFSVGRHSIIIERSDTLALIHEHPLINISCISSFLWTDIGFVCYVYKEPNTAARRAFTYCVSTSGLELQMVQSVTEMFAQLYREKREPLLQPTLQDVSQSRSSLKDISFNTGDSNLVCIARLQDPRDLNLESFQKLDFILPSSNPISSTSASTIDNSGDLNYRITNRLKRRATDGTEYVANNMLHFERWFHGTNILYSRDCLREPGDFYVYEWNNRYILRILNMSKEVEEVVLHSEPSSADSTLHDHEHDYFSVSHYINYHMAQKTVFKQLNGAAFTLRNPILRVIEDRCFKR